jgi:hypothetical protein
LHDEAPAGLTDRDDEPEPPDEATSRPGDLWLLGQHRLLCGDAANPADVDRLLDDAPVHLVNTDPPNNVHVEPRSNNAVSAGNSSFGLTQHQSFDVARDRSKIQPTTASEPVQFGHGGSIMREAVGRRPGRSYCPGFAPWTFTQSFPRRS